MADADFARYILEKKPPDTPPFARADVYRRLVRGAFRGVFTAAFPKTNALFDADELEALLGDFLDAGGPSTPFFRDIAGDLVAWAGHIEHPLADLLQWEWLEKVAARH